MNKTFQLLKSIRGYNVYTVSFMINLFSGPFLFGISYNRMGRGGKSDNGFASIRVGLGIIAFTLYATVFRTRKPSKILQKKLKAGRKLKKKQ